MRRRVAVPEIFSHAMMGKVSDFSPGGGNDDRNVINRRKK
jgi:hypothetical protein